MIGPCEAWIDADAVFDCTPCADIELPDNTLAALAANAASELLYYWSGRRFPGICDATVRPCRTSPCWGTQVLEGGTILDTGSCGCGAASRPSCGCPEPSWVRLPGRVVEVSEVLVDGAVVDPGVYRVDEHRRLVRTDGGTWPTCQDIGAATTEANTFQITYTRGSAPPNSGVLAAKALACQLYKGCSGGDCAIPAKVTNVVRQGVSMQFVRPQEVGLKDGLVVTGLEAVSLFLAAFPARRRASIASPDVGATVLNV